jgi:oxygen-dependent protoporphyrinogen oxidase
VKAVTFSTVKWPHLNEGRRDTVVVRCSIGRFRDEHLLQRPDEDLRAVAIAEMADVCHAGELPVETRISRWGGGLPQYNVGHADLVARVRGAVAGQPGLALAGAAYDGLGIPTCVATARSAAARILEHLRSGGGSEHVSDGAAGAEAESAGPEQGDPLHDVVGLPGEESGRGRP